MHASEALQTRGGLTFPELENKIERRRELVDILKGTRVRISMLREKGDV